MVHLKMNIYFVIVLTYILYVQNTSSDWFDNLQIHQWANEIGTDIWNAGLKLTKKHELEQAYRNEIVEEINGTETIDNMTKLLNKMFDLKINALKEIVENAEVESFNFINISDTDLTVCKNWKKKMFEEEIISKYSFSKNSNNLSAPYNESLKENSHFFNTPVDTEFSTYHVPTYVNECANESIRDIMWSEKLDEVFKRNYNENLTLSWQYFGTLSGIMRLYPGANWNKGNEPVDLYDSRMQPWYIGAASSPKDLIILVDNSGSMMGQKQKIARNAVNTILETLNANDFVNVISFGDKVKYVVGCFNRKLVQANLENIQELKIGVKGIMNETNGIANFSGALTEAFDILNQHHQDETAAMCNQAIMLITDGATENYKSIFEKYNWKNSTHKPFPVRVFTFGIGGDGSDNRHIVWMACANQGYYVQINTITEVREQVLKYINVMARPLVLENAHLTAWTPLYAHVVDPKLSSWLWKQEENKMQKEYSKAYKFFLDDSKKDILKLPNFKIDRIQDYDEYINSDNFPYNLTTSVSLPAYDRRNLSENVPSLLGVAATDIPVTVFHEVLDPYSLGVNNYGFIVDNNGYVIIHPDLRPAFQGILKPHYNNIDISEVELVDDGSNIRNFSSDIVKFRDLIINQTSTSYYLRVKYHYDNMRRVSSSGRTYYTSKIDKSPFTAVISISDNWKYRIKQPVNIRLFENVLTYFGNDNWAVHPNWFYCKSDDAIRSSKEEIANAFALLKAAHWKWPNSSEKYVYIAHTVKCNKELMTTLLHDANVTRNLFADFTSIKNLIERYKVTNIFVATRSGLTRWRTTVNGQIHYPSFELANKKSIDEIWYKRAVEQHTLMPDSFAFWFNSSDIQNKPADYETLITASYAVMVKKGDRKAPAAVIGFQFNQSTLQELFMNSSLCRRNCNSISLDISYYMLDHNAYIVAAKDNSLMGKFFGAVNGKVMKSLITHMMYREITIYDYQAVCFNDVDGSANGASTLLVEPLKHAINLISWLIGSLIWCLCHVNLQWITAITQGPPKFVEIGELGRDRKELKRIAKILATLNRTFIVPCDQIVNLYELITEPKYMNTNKTIERPNWYKATKIPHTNLVLVIVNNLENPLDYAKEDNFDTIPKEYEYNDFRSSTCYKTSHNGFSRCRVKYCKKEHDKEKLLKLCGNGRIIGSSPRMITLLVSIIVASYYEFFNY